MLSIERRLLQNVEIDTPIGTLKVKILRIGRDNIRIGFEGPSDYIVCRPEAHNRYKRNLPATKMLLPNLQDKTKNSVAFVRELNEYKLIGLTGVWNNISLGDPCNKVLIAVNKLNDKIYYKNLGDNPGLNLEFLEILVNGFKYRTKELDLCRMLFTNRFDLELHYWILESLGYYRICCWNCCSDVENSAIKLEQKKFEDFLRIV